MSTFITELVDSIFTPGTNKSLILATNLSFGALQVVLASLLLATQSIHFVILSVLSASLWWAINWFVRELESAKQKEETANRLREVRREKDKARRTSLLGSPAGGQTTEGEGDDEDEDDTETEGMDRSVASEAPVNEKTPLLSVPAGGNEKGLRRRSVVEGELSTEDEWEKVDGSKQ